MKSIGTRQVSLGEVAILGSGSTPSKGSEEYWGGDFPWVTARDLKTPRLNDSILHLTEVGKSRASVAEKGSLLVLVRGMTLHKDLPLAVTDVDMAFNQDVKSLTPRKGVNVNFLYYVLSSEKKNILKMVDSSGHGTGKLDTDRLRSVTFELPPIDSQNEIVAVLQQWDQLIEKQERLILAKQKALNAQLIRLITSSGGKKVAISEFAREISTRNKGSEHGVVLSVTNKKGFVLPSEYFDRRIASENVANYKVVVKGQYAYNPSRINVGSIARLDSWDAGILSPMYVVFELDANQIHSDYFMHWLDSPEAKQRIRFAAQGSVRESVNFNDFDRIKVPLPGLPRQEEITALLSLLTREIDLLKQLVEKYRVQKNGLARKLLSGEWRVQPKETSHV